MNKLNIYKMPWSYDEADCLVLSNDRVIADAECGEWSNSNAHLIAAAPDLYNSLIELTTIADKPPTEKDIFEIEQRAMMAIRKARGEHD